MTRHKDEHRYEQQETPQVVLNQAGVVKQGKRRIVVNQRRDVHQAILVADRAYELEHANILNDGLFKYVFGTERNKHLTIDFLNSFLQKGLGHAIEDIEFIDKEPIAESIQEKNIRYDISLKLNTHEKVDIEVQRSNRHDMISRAVYYWARMYNQLLRAGQQYKELKPFIVLSLLNFNLFEHKSSYMTSCHIRDDESNECISPLLSLNFLELTKFKLDRSSFEENLACMSKKGKWLAFLSNRLTLSEKECIAMSDENIKQACDAVKKYMSDDAQYFRYMNQEINELDIAAERAATIEESEARGEIKKRIQTVLNLLRKGMDLSFVKDVTGSPVDEIYRVAREHGLQVR